MVDSFSKNGKTPPNGQRFAPDEAERAVLCCMLHENAWIDELSLSETDFRTCCHQLIYRAIRDLSKKHQPARLDSVAELLHQRNQDGDAPPKYLGELWTATFGYEMGNYYAQAVREHAYRRSLALYAGEIRRWAEDGCPVADLAEKLRVQCEKAEAVVEGRGLTAESAEPLLTCYADVLPQQTRWLWRPWIPLGAVSLLDGDPGLGKSTISTDLAARVSRCWAMPSGSSSLCEPARVLLLNAEDDPECTIRPRLDAAGADPAMILSLDAIKRGDDETPPVLPWDIALMEKLIRDQHVALVIIDPFMAYLDGGIDAHRDQDVRRCLHRLKLLAQATGVAILVIRHLNKLVGGPALYRGGGSIGIIGAARSALVVGRDPAASNSFVLACSKNNLAPMPKSLNYGLESVSGDIARVAWGGETELMADDILAHIGGKRRQSAGEQAAQAIREIVGSSVMDSEALSDACRQRGFTENAIRDGRRLAGIKPRKVGFDKDARWMVSLPSKGGI